MVQVRMTVEPLTTSSPGSTSRDWNTGGSAERERGGGVSVREKEKNE